VGRIVQHLVRARLDWQLRRDLSPPAPTAFGAFGAGSVIVPPARVSEPGCIQVGRETIVLEGVWLSVVRAHEGIVPSLRIGDRVRLGRGASIACIGEVVIEDDVGSSDDVFIADCYHEYADPATPVLYQPMSKPRPVRIGAGAYLGAGCAVLGGVTVGPGAYVGEGAVVTRDLPAGAVAFGNPAQVVDQVAR
jgi:acetyltransferase-like isoleucine patch superfamily enzyme